MSTSPGRAIFRFAVVAGTIGLAAPAVVRAGAILGVGSDVSLTSTVRTYQDADGDGSFETPLDNFAPFGGTHTGGARVALGDTNGDGIPDMVVGSGEGGPSSVRAFTLGSLTLLHNFMPYGPTYTGGVYISAGDLSGDGAADMPVGPNPGAGPLVRSFHGDTGEPLNTFFAYAPGFLGGVTVASGDVNGDGRADIITGPASGEPPNVRAFSGVDLEPLHSFNAYEANFAGGVSVASGDVNGDGRDDIITGAGPGGGPHVKVFSGVDGSELRSFLPFGGGFSGGVRVAAADVNGDGRADLIVGQGPGGGRVRVLDGITLNELDAFAPFGESYSGGVFVSAIVPEPATAFSVLMMLAVGMRRR